MSDADKELLALGAQPHDDELEALGAVNVQKQAPAKADAMGPIQSAGEGLAMGGTYGLAPRISGVQGAAMEKLAGAPLGPEQFPLVPGMESSKDKNLKDLYEEYKQAAQQRADKAKASNPALYHTAEFAGALASPINKVASVGLGSTPLVAEAGSKVPMLAKMGQSALGGARIGTVAGLAQAPDLTNAKQDVQSAGTGMVLGNLAGTFAPPVAATLGAAADVAGTGLKSVFGPVGQRFSQGMAHGAEGAPNLATESGQEQATQMRGEFADQFVDDLHDVLKSNAKNKRELIAQALDKNQLAPEDAVNAVTQKYLNANPKMNDPTAQKELQQLKDLILTAKEGPEQVETVRQYLPNAPQRTLPGEMPISASPEAEGIPSQAEAAPQEEPAPPSTDSTAQRNNTPISSSESPSDFAGYESVHKATIDPEDDEARAAFQQKIHEKMADEEALGQNSNNNPVEIHEAKLPNGQVRLIAKRAKVQEDADAFKDQAVQLVKQQREDQRLQALLDQQQTEKLKFQQQQDAELNKPQFQDVQQTVRPNDRNLQNPEELYQLQKDLQAKSQFSEGRGFSSQQMNQMSGQAAKDVASLIKMTIPETVPVDERLTAFNNVAERLGIDTDKLSLPGGEGQKARADAMKKVMGMLNPEAPTNKSVLDQNTIDYVKQQLGKVHPDIADSFADQAAQHSENAGLIKDMSKPYEPSGINLFMNAIRRNASKASYGLGHALGSEVGATKAAIQPEIQGTQKAFQNYAPDVLQSAAAKASTSSDPTMQKFSQVLSKMSQADERTRNAMMFTLQQNPGYRQMMGPLFPEQEKSTPQAKDMSLEKFK